MTKGAHIPDDIAADILLRLPSKSLLRFKSACKTWYSLISDSEFINLRTKRASENPKILLSTGSHLHLLDHQSSSFSSSSSSSSSSLLAFPDETSPFHPLKIIGSSRGLVCLASSTATATNNPKNKIFIWNPSTGDIRKIPFWLPRKLEHTDYLHGFAYDSVSNDFILVISVNVGSYFYFSFKKNRWLLTLTGANYTSRAYLAPATTRPSTTLATESNGVLHWLVTPDHDYDDDPKIRIMTFNLARRKLQKNWLKIPSFVSWSRTSGVVGLFEHRGCLCIYFSPNNRSKEIWMMERYGDNKSWIHLLTVENSVSQLPSGFDFRYAPILCISPSNEIILRDDQTFIRFRSKEGKFDEAVTIQPYVNSAALYAVDTLVSPNDFNAGE